MAPQAIAMGTIRFSRAETPRMRTDSTPPTRSE